MSDADQPLQFDTAIPLDTAEAATSEMACHTCQRPIRDEYFDVNGLAVCASCRAVLAEHGQPLRGVVPHLRAAVFGFGAALAGAALYYAVLKLLSLEIGLVAIAIGYMVGYAIRKATRGRGSRLVQVIAIALTYWSVGLAYFPILIEAVYERQAAASQPARAPAATEQSESGNSLAAITTLFLLTFALPAMTVFASLPGGLLSAAIIGFGMHQAWKMTGRPPLLITGPFRLGASAPAVS